MDMIYCKDLHPILDKKNMFMFFSHNKVAQTSVNRRLLKDRVIVYKDNPQFYEEHFDKVIPDSFDSIYKFTIVRNPWDRVVSGFFYLRGKKRLKKKLSMDISSMSFDKFVRQVLVKYGADLDAHFEFQHPKVFYKGSCFVDYIGRLENITEDWGKISKIISAPSELPHRNRSSHDPYQSYYTDQTKKIVQDIYAEDIDFLKYSFPN